MDTHDPRARRGLARFEAISAYLAQDPPRGQRKLLLEQLASKVWLGPDGAPMQVSAETLRSWIRRYRHGGLDALMDKARPKRGVSALSEEVVAKACALKKEVPERSLDRIIRILEELEMVELGTVRRSTLHRVLQARGLSRRPAPSSDRTDLDRFEADAPNKLWQSDMLAGPFLPDPERPGKMRRAWLYAFLDDRSRLLLDGRFSFKGDLPALELVFRRAVQRWGAPGRLYYDNALVYRSGHMRQIAASLGVHRVVHTQPYRPMGHGKIEALNRLIRSSFLAELKASTITTVAALNEAFAAWTEIEYNRVTHSQTGQSPMDRWRAGIEQVRYVDDEVLRLAFLWSERRTPDKTGVFSLFGVRYQVGTELARRRIEVRFDPEALHEVEVHLGGRFRERARPLEVHPWRRPKPKPADGATATLPTHTPEVTADWLGHLTERHRDEGGDRLVPRDLKDKVDAERHELTEQLVTLLAHRLDDDVFDEVAVRAFLARFGPFDPERAEDALDRVLAEHPADLHVDFYLHSIREAHR